MSRPSVGRGAKRRREPWSQREWTIALVSVMVTYGPMFALGAFVYQQTQGCP